VNCCQSWVNQDRSDEGGHFAIKNTGQILTFLKIGYTPRSLLLETGGADVRLGLERETADDWRIPVCKGSSSEHRLSGLPLSMAMPKGVRGKRFSSRSFAIIHGKTRYSIRLSERTDHVQNLWPLLSECSREGCSGGRFEDLYRLRCRNRMPLADRSIQLPTTFDAGEHAYDELCEYLKSVTDDDFEKAERHLDVVVRCLTGDVPVVEEDPNQGRLPFDSA
jgi:hypothetical protein